MNEHYSIERQVHNRHNEIVMRTMPVQDARGDLEAAQERARQLNRAAEAARRETRRCGKTPKQIIRYSVLTT